MTVDAATARRDLLVRVRDVLKAVRVVKNQPMPRATDVPAGTLGVLSVIARLGEVGTPSAEGTPAACHGKELAARCALDPSTISRAVAALVRTGLVGRTADPADGRASMLTITPHGRAVVDETFSWYDDLLADALRDWSVRDLTRLATLLQRFTDDMLARFDDRADRSVPTQRGPTTTTEPEPATNGPITNSHTILEAAR